MQVNSVNPNQNNPSFGRLVFKNKKRLVRQGEAYVDRFLNTPAVKRFAESSSYDLHIKPTGVGHGLAWRIKSVGMGVKGFLNNIKAPWQEVWCYNCDMGDKAVNKYLKDHHEQTSQMVMRRIVKENRDKQAVLVEKLTQMERSHK